MTISDIQNLIDLLNEAPEVAELSVTAPDGSEVSLKRSNIALQSRPAAVMDVDGAVAETAQDVSLASETVPEPALSAIAATMVGIYHAAKPAVEVGATVKAGQRVGAIESMKLMNDVVSTASGVVRSVLIEEGLPVEYGQVLFEVAAEPIL